MFDAMGRDDDGKITDPYDDAKVIARCVCDEDGKRIFKPADIPRIITMGNDIVLGIVSACLRINGMGTVGREALEKNS